MKREGVVGLALRAWALTGALTCVLASAPATAQPRKAYLEACEDDDLRRLADLSSSLDEEDHERAAATLDALFDSASELDRGDRVRKVEEFHYQGLGAHLASLLRRAPAPVLARLRTLQSARAAQALRGQEPPSPRALLRRYPTCDQAGEAAETLWARAFEAGDRGGCERLRRFLADLHPERQRTPSGRARLALLLAAQGKSDAVKTLLAKLREQVGAKAALLKRTRAASRALLSGAKASASSVAPRPHATLEETSNVLLNPDKPAPSRPRPPRGGRRNARRPPGRPFSPSFPMRRGEVVCVSNGASLVTFGLDGELQTRLPHHGGAASTVPPPSTGFQARLTSWAGVGFAPLVLERWLAPARRSARGDASLAGRFYSLVAFDLESARVLWWDGDAGPRDASPALLAPAPPPGWSQVGRPLLEVLGRSHVLACAADSRRVYVALTLKGEEPELRLAAYELDTGSDQRLVLRPAWRRATFLLSAERAQGSSEEESVAAEIAASLSLDGRGRLVCTTNLGITACVETGDGRLLWLQKGRRNASHSGSFRGSSRGTRPLPPPPEPARIVTQGGLERIVFFAGSHLTSVEPEDGALVWRRESGGAHRLIAQEDQLVAYGGSGIRVFALDGTRLGERRLRFPCVGQGVRLGDSLLLPLMSNRGRRVVTIDRFAIRMSGALRLVPISSTPLDKVQDAVNLSPLPDGLVAASQARAVFLRWR